MFNSRENREHTRNSWRSSESLVAKKKHTEAHRSLDLVRGVEQLV